MFILIVTLVVMIILIFGGIAVLFVNFSHPDDSNQAFFPRAVCVLGLFLAIASVMALPLDVAINSFVLDSVSINMHLVWLILGLTISIFMVLIIPFAMFYYESETDPEKEIPIHQSQFCQAMIYTFLLLTIFCLIFGSLYFTNHTAVIPYQRKTINWTNAVKTADLTIAPIVCPTEGVCKSTTETFELSMSISTFVVAVSSWMGWFLFVLFGGIGLGALPLSWINDFRTRPAAMPVEEYAKQKIRISERATLLKETGELLKKDEIKYMGKSPARKIKNEHKRNIIKFENAVRLLKIDWIFLETSFELKGGNPLVAYGKLFLGIIGLIISLMWWLHIILFMLLDPPPTTLLNDLFIAMTIEQFQLPGIFAFAFQSLWLFMCVIKGVFMFGLRVPFLIRLYPMEIGGTLLNSFLVNTWILLICALPTVHFCAQAFPVYARNTEVNILFGAQIKNIEFFGNFFQNNIFIICLLVISFLSVLYGLLCAPDHEQEIDKQIKELQEINSAKN